MTIIGRLTKDEKIGTLSNGKQVVNFSVATNESYKNKQGERIEQTTYYYCSYWISTKVATLLTKRTSSPNFIVPFISLTINIFAIKGFP